MASYLNDRGAASSRRWTPAARFNAKPGQVAPAWLRDRPAVTAPIASATTMAQLEELTTAIRLQLDKAAIDELDGASA